jgi:uncharacterized ParB-like nuclease family protein
MEGKSEVVEAPEGDHFPPLPGPPVLGFPAGFAKGPPMLEIKRYPIASVHVPVKRAKTLDPAKVEALARDMLENGQTTPISLRADGERFVLIEGYHRLEALRALGEDTVEGYLVRARMH